MPDLTDDAANQLDIARRLLRKARQASTAAERTLMLDVAANLEAAAQGLLEATRALRQRLDGLEDADGEDG